MSFDENYKKICESIEELRKENERLTELVDHLLQQRHENKLENLKGGTK